MAGKIKKLLNKISKKDREKLLDLIGKLVGKETRGLDIVKVINTDFYRLRSGRYRIIYHLEGSNVFVDSIKLRNEKTYN